MAKDNVDIAKKIFAYIQHGVDLNEDIKQVYKNSLIFIGDEKQIYIPVTNSYVGIGETRFQKLESSAVWEKGFGNVSVQTKNSGSNARGAYSVAEGKDSVAIGEASHAEGNSASIGQYSHAEGTSTAGAQYSHAEGFMTNASGDYAHAEGNSTTSSGNDSHAEGNNTIASGGNSHAEGSRTTSFGEYSHSEGSNTNAQGTSSHAEGRGAIASGNNGSHAEGYNTLASGNSGSHAEGYDTTASGEYSHAEGFNTTASNDDAHAEGNGTLAKGDSSHAEGKDTTASGEYSHAEGVSTYSRGDISHAEGYMTFSRGDNSHAEGYMSYSYGDNSHAEGKQSTTYGEASHAEGRETTAYGANSHSEGNSTYAAGINSHVEGRSSRTSGTDSHAEGFSTYAVGEGSHTEGHLTYSIGNYSHSEGELSYSIGISSHAQGYNTYAYGPVSHSEGIYSYAIGSYSHASGVWTYTYYTAETAVGSYNLSHHVDTGSNIRDSIFEIGIGNDNASRKNAFSTMNNGDIYIYGVGDYDGTNPQDAETFQERFNRTNIWERGDGDLSAQTIETGAQANGNYSVAEGEYTYTNGRSSHTEGYGTVTGGSYGSNTLTANTSTTDGDFAHAEGNATIARGNSSHSEGIKTYASGKASHVEGWKTTASGDASHAEGGSITLAISGGRAYGSGSHAEGGSTTASNNFAHAEGRVTTASGESSHAEGRSTTASGNYGSHAEGNDTMSIGDSSHSEGSQTITYGNNSHSEGQFTYSYAFASHSEGYFSYTYTNATYSHAEGWLSKTQGVASHAEGYLTYSIGQASHVEGTLSKASGNSSHAEGYDSSALGAYSHAEGGSQSSGEYSHAEGNSSATGQYSHSEGNMTTAQGKASHAEGNGTTSFADYSHAEGASTTASNNASHAEGASTTASGIYSHAEGSNTTAYGQISHAEGQYTYTAGQNSHAEGFYSRTSGKDSHVEGQYSYSYATSSHAEGGFAYTMEGATYSHAEGWLTKTQGVASHAEGYKTLASGTNSHAEGSETTASGEASHTEGLDTRASGNFGSHAEGHLTISSGGSSHTEGSQTRASGDASHAEGCNTNASGITSHTEGWETIASGDYGSHAEGDNTIASGISSHTEGLKTRAKGDNSHSEGRYTYSYATASHTEGHMTYTYTEATYSHAEGQETKTAGVAAHAEGYLSYATGDYSHAGGSHTYTSHTAETAIGTYNLSETVDTGTNVGESIFEIGIGTSDSNRKNAMMQLSNGDLYIYNIGDYDGTNPIDAETFQERFNRTNIWERGTGNLSAQTIGTGAQATDGYSVAEGKNTLASGVISHAEGQNTSASGVASHAEGNHTEASGDSSHTEGDTTKSSGWGSHTEGIFTNAGSIATKPTGIEDADAGDAAHAEGNATSAFGLASHAEGEMTYSVGEASHAEGYATEANAIYSHSEGEYTYTKGRSSHSEGEYTYTNGVSSHAEGYGTVTGGSYTSNTLTAGSTTNTGDYAHAEGNATIAKGNSSHSEGIKTFASGNGSHVEGNQSIASGAASHAEGWHNIASGVGAHAEGGNFEEGGNTASGFSSHVEGQRTYAVGAATHAEGNRTTAYQQYSHAEGSNTYTLGQSSHTEGVYTYTYNVAEHAQGQYNVSVKANDTFGNAGNTHHTIGIGTSNSNRKNAVTVMQNGNAYIIGIGNYDGTNLNSARPLQDIMTAGHTGVGREDNAGIHVINNWHIDPNDGSVSYTYHNLSGNTGTFNSNIPKTPTTGTAIKVGTSIANGQSFVTGISQTADGKVTYSYSSIYTLQSDYQYHQLKVNTTPSKSTGHETGTYAAVINGIANTNNNVNATTHTISYSVTYVATKKYVDDLISANDAMRYCGTVTPASTSGGAISLIHSTNAGAGHGTTADTDKGAVYKVNGTGFIGTQRVSAGDMIISYQDNASATSDTGWDVINENIDLRQLAAPALNGDTGTRVLTNVELTGDGTLSYTYNPLSVSNSNSVWNLASKAAGSGITNENIIRSNGGNTGIPVITYVHLTQSGTQTTLSYTYTYIYANQSHHDDSPAQASNGVKVITNLDMGADGILSYTYNDLSVDTKKKGSALAMAASTDIDATDILRSNSATQTKVYPVITGVALSQTEDKTTLSYTYSYIYTNQSHHSTTKPTTNSNSNLTAAGIKVLTDVSLSADGVLTYTYTNLQASSTPNADKWHVYSKASDSTGPNATYYLTFVDSNNTGTNGDYEVGYTSTYVSLNTKTGVLSTNRLKITYTGSSTYHLEFSRAGYNYVYAPANGVFAFITGDESFTTINVDMKIANKLVAPGKTNNVNLGNSTYMWNSLYANKLYVGTSGASETAYIYSSGNGTLRVDANNKVVTVWDESSIRRGASNTTVTSGTSTYPWANTYSVKGNFTGTVVVPQRSDSIANPTILFGTSETTYGASIGSASSSNSLGLKAGGNIYIYPSGTTSSGTAGGGAVVISADGMTVKEKITAEGLTSSGQITSTVADGTAPFVITSSTLNAHLNADLLDGKHLNEVFDSINFTGGQLKVTVGGVEKSVTVGDATNATNADKWHVYSKASNGTGPNATYYLTFVDSNNTGTNGDYEIGYTSSYVSLNTKTGVLNANRLHITYNGVEQVLSFGRNGVNYITAPENGSFAFISNGKVTAASNIQASKSDLIITHDSVYPGTTNNNSLGKEANRWSTSYSVVGDFTEEVVAKSFTFDDGYTKQLSAAGWYRAVVSTRGVGGGVSIILSINRSYNHGDNESYTISINVMYSGTVSISQLSGSYNIQAIPKIRVCQKNGAKAYVDIYYNRSDANSIQITVVGTGTVSDLSAISALDDGYTATEFNLGKGMSTNGTINANSASQLATGRNFRVSDNTAAHQGAQVLFDGTADIELKLPAYITANINGSASTTYEVKTIRNATNATYYLTFVDSDNNVALSGTSPSEKLYTTPNISINPNSGAVTGTGLGTFNRIKITNESADKHIEFARASWNYLSAPTSGSIAFVTNGKAVGAANTDLVVQDKVVAPGSNLYSALGSSSLRWNGIYSSTGNFSGQITSTATGAPFVIASTTKVDNLNADLLDGKHLSELNTSITYAFSGSGTSLSVTFSTTVGGTTKSTNAIPIWGTI